jgi:hypothetical protein
LWSNDPNINIIVHEKSLKTCIFWRVFVENQKREIMAHAKLHLVEGKLPGHACSEIMSLGADHDGPLIKNIIIQQTNYLFPLFLHIFAACVQLNSKGR